MSQYFNDATTRQTLWNPATRVAQLFFQMSEALVAVADQPSGVVDLETDEYAVDSEALTRFVDAVVRQYLGSNHTVMKGMLAGYLAPALVMVERSGQTVAALTTPTDRSTVVVSLNVDAVDPAADQQELIRLATAASRTMPV